MVRRRTGIESRIEQFFDANPHEWLTVADAAEKFNVAEHTLRNALTRLRGIGAIETAQVIFAPRREETRG
jgi:predicted transcriptional regulator of viral defense system